MISVFEPRLSINDKYSVIKTLFKNEISGTSPIVQEFEKSAAKSFNRDHAVAVSNGSIALDLAFQLIDFSDGDEVVLPSFTIVSCLSAVVRAKAVPVFCDVNKDTWNMTFEDVKSKITKRTKAVLVVHLYGLTAEIEKIEKYCNENNIILIEDAAEAHGQIAGNRKCGSFGLISTMSFYANKHVTTGEGGLLLTNNKEVKKKADLMRNLGFRPEKRFQHDEFYWNYRLGGLQASLGVSQLKNLEKNISGNLLKRLMTP
jgi:perosamine synthetase